MLAFLTPRPAQRVRHVIVRFGAALARRRRVARQRLAGKLFSLSDALLGWRGARPAVIRMVLRGANARSTPTAFLPIVWLDNCPPVTQFVPGRRGTAVSPNIGGRFVAADVALPPVCLYAFPNVAVVAGSSLFVSEKNVIIERVAGVDDARCVFQSGALVAHGRHLAAVARRPVLGTSLENGFFLSGYGGWNYYHWMIELLPKLQYWHTLAPELRAYPLLVSEAVRDHGSMMEALAVFCDGAEIRVLNDDEEYTVGRLLHINAPNTCPFNLRADDEVRVTDFLLRPEVIHEWRTRVGISPRRSTPGRRRLFLARSGAHRSYNEAEVLPVFIREGFEPVYLERMSLSEQIDAMSSAELLAGPTGAAWTNLIFCNHGAKGLCWLPDQSQQFSAFSTIASIVGVDLRYLTYPTSARSTAELYSANYRLEATEVERALAGLLAEARA
jgi:capsular polysaccharide biosynthesis protein